MHGSVDSYIFNGKNFKEPSLDNFGTQVSYQIQASAEKAVSIRPVRLDICFYIPTKTIKQILT